MRRNKNINKLIIETGKKLQLRNEEMVDEIIELLVLCRIKYGSLDPDVDARLSELEKKYKD
jgi:hypothetical protein